MDRRRTRRRSWPLSQKRTDSRKPMGMSGRAWRVLRRNRVGRGGCDYCDLLVLMAAAAVFARQNMLTANELLAQTTAAMLQLQLEARCSRQRDGRRPGDHRGDSVEKQD